MAANPQANTNEEPDTDAGEMPAGEGQQPSATFDSWLANQDDTVKGMLEQHTTGLRSSLKSERDQRKALEKQIRETAATLEAGSDARKQLETLSGQLIEAESRATFYESAASAGIKNAKLAYLAARDAQLIDELGKVDIGKLKELYPDLFEVPQRRPTPPGNAGSGTQAPKGATGMNDFIRQSAGRK